MHRALPARAHGASTVEFIIIGVLFFALLGGLFEMAYVFRTKITLNRVAMEAARAGALNNALLSKMNDAVERGMTPLYMSGDPSMTGLTTALVKAKAVGTELATFKRLVKVISPTHEIFEKFKTQQIVSTNLYSGASKMQWVIPNDNLGVRTRSLQTVTLNGGSAQINLQDANLLKIQVWWCHVLIVPGLDKVIHEIASGSILGSSREQLACDAVATTLGLAGASRYAIPVSAHAVIRMQSPIVYQDSNLPS